MFDQLSAEILASLIKGFPRTRTTTKQNVDPAVYYVYSRVKIQNIFVREHGVHAGPKDYFVVVVVVICG
jgi:hypothetical protein